MFGGQFSHTKFGLSSSDELEVETSAIFSDSLKGVAGFGVVTQIEEAFFDGLKASIRVTTTLPTRFQSGDSLQGDVDMLGGVVVSFTPKEHLQSVSGAVIEPVIDIEFQDNLGASIWVGKNMVLSGSIMYSKDELQLSGYLSKDLLHSQVLTDILSANVSTVILDNTTVSISVEIPPGSTLEIDSDTYDVFLDGENILHLHKGDWLFLDRSVVSLSVDSGTGGVFEGKVLYGERYL